MSDEINRYALMMEALNELKQEVDSSRQVKPTPTPALPCVEVEIRGGLEIIKK